MKELNRQMAKGVAWMMLFKFTGRGLGLISTIILARLLMPADFGLVAMAMSIIAVLELMGYFSFDIMLIQKQDAERAHYDTAWTFNVLFGLSAALILFLLAKPTADFYGEQRLIIIMYLLAIGTLIHGFENIGIVAFRKEMQFNREFNFMFLKKLSGFIVTIPLAFWLRNYWALVIGMLTMKVVGVGLSYIMHPYRPRLSLATSKELFSFSKWIFLMNVFEFLWLRSADFIIGRVSGVKMLGLFSISYEISNLPTTELSAPINRAVFPGYAKISSDRSELRQSFINVLSLIAVFALPAGIGIAAVAPLLVTVFLGENWVDAIPLIAILAVYGTTNAMLTNTGTVFLAIGKPHYLAIISAIRVAVLLPTLTYFALQNGVIGAAWSYLGVSLLFMPIIYALLFRSINLRSARFFAEIWRPLIATSAMFVTVKAFTVWAGTTAGILGLSGLLITAVTLGAVVYSAVLLLLWQLAGRPTGAERFVADKLSVRIRNSSLARFFNQT